jgi:16S rRNA (guanine527-N7)-methyltransferase
MARLVAGCQELGIPLSAPQIDQFERYFHLLVAWNARLNLTAITGYEDVQIKHYLDSLVSLPLLAEEYGASLPLTRPLRTVDVGAGAGFPGLPLKIATPALTLTLMDGTQKKVNFLQEVAAGLELTDVHFVTGRAEELGRQELYREQFDLVTARAVAPLNTLVEYLLPLTALNGLAVIYKGPGAPEEFAAARQAIRLLGGETVRFAPATVPFLAERRFVLLVKKTRPTPKQFPRGQGLPRKRPLT